MAGALACVLVLTGCALVGDGEARQISRDDLAAKSGIAKEDIEAIEEGNKEIEEGIKRAEFVKKGKTINCN